MAACWIAIQLSGVAVAQSVAESSLGNLPTSLRLMLEDANTMAREGEFRIAHELVDAVVSQSNDAEIRSLTNDLKLEIDRLQHGKHQRNESHEPNPSRTDIVRISDLASEDGRVAYIAKDIEPTYQKPVAMLLSHREHTAIQASKQNAHRSPVSTSELPTESRSVPLLDELTRSLGVATNVRPTTDQTTDVQRPALPTIVINPPAVSHASDVAPITTAAYSPQQVTYFSAICFAIGLLMCPATLLVGMTLARRMSGQQNPLFQISVVRDDGHIAAPTFEPTSTTETRSPADILATQDAVVARNETMDPISGKSPNTTVPQLRTHASNRESTMESPQILRMPTKANVEPTTTLCDTASVDIFRQIVDHNVSLQRTTQRTNPA